MKVAELLARLQGVDPGLEVVMSSATSTVVACKCAGLLQAIPTHRNKSLVPGHEWRVPINRLDEPDTDRVSLFFVG